MIYEPSRTDRRTVNDVQDVYSSLFIGFLETVCFCICLYSSYIRGCNEICTTILSNLNGIGELGGLTAFTVGAG